MGGKETFKKDLEVRGEREREWGEKGEGIGERKEKGEGR